MFHHWEYIYQVYQEKSFSRAADKLHITQPSLSLTIKKAEEQIGASIFDRSSTPVRLTEFGEKYIHAVETIKKMQSDLEDYICDVNELKRGHISIGTGNFFLSYLLPPMLSYYRAAYPQIQIDIYENPTKDIIQKLSSGLIDIVISNSVLCEPEYKGYLITKEKLVLAVPSARCPEGASKEAKLTFDGLYGENAEEGACADLNDFAELPFIMLKPGNNTRTITDKLFAAVGVSPHITLELDQAATMYRLAASGMGAAIVSNTLAKMVGPLGDIIFFRLGGECTSRNICIYTKGGAAPSRAAAAFIDMALDYIPKYLS